MTPLDQTPRRAWLVWGVGLAAYFVAVFHRSSLAVAGLAAAERFEISAAQLSTFVMLQLLVYAGMQIPVGLLVDRFGPRRVILVGAVILTLAQAGFAFADSFATALIARAFVGVGDAMTFVCLLRLVNSWFAVRAISQVTLVTGPVGQLGAVLAATPMTIALASVGWTRAYLISAAVGAVVTVAVLFFVHDEPGTKSVRGPALSWVNIRKSLAASWAQPGTRLGFWVHFSTQFSATVLGLLWGFPYFVEGEHKSAEFAGVLLSIAVVAVVVSGPILGRLIVVYPWHRSSLVIGIILAIVAVWTLTLCWPGDAPDWLLVLLVIVAGVGGPASMIGFDYARSANPLERLASATGIVNQGGFFASLILVIAIGLILDHTDRNYVAAMSFQYVLWTIGLTQIWRYRVKTRAQMKLDDPDKWGHKP